MGDDMYYWWWQIVLVWAAFGCFNVGAWMTAYDGPAEKENSVAVVVFIGGPFATILFIGGLAGLVAKGLRNLDKG